MWEVLVDYFSLEMQVEKEDGIDIYKARDCKEIMEKMSKPIPFCKHCRISERTTGHPYSLSEKKREEWIDD